MVVIFPAEIVLVWALLLLSRASLKLIKNPISRNGVELVIGLLPHLGNRTPLKWVKVLQNRTIDFSRLISQLISTVLNRTTKAGAHIFYILYVVIYWAFNVFISRQTWFEELRFSRDGIFRLNLRVRGYVKEAVSRNFLNVLVWSLFLVFVDVTTNMLFFMESSLDGVNGKSICSFVLTFMVSISSKCVLVCLKQVCYTHSDRLGWLESSYANLCVSISDCIQHGELLWIPPSVNSLNDM